MKTCFSTLGCPEWSFSDIVSVSSDLGYNGIEIRGVLGELYAPAIEPFSPSQIAATKQKLQSLSLSIPCLTSSCNLNDEDILEKVTAYVDTASAVGAPYIRLLGDKAPGPSDGVSFKIIMSNLIDISNYAKDKGVMPLIETNGFFAKTKVLAALLHELDTDRIGVLYDIHHPYRFFGEHPAYTLKNIGPYIKHVHVKDSVMSGKKVYYKMVGEGDVPVADAVHALIDFGYEGYFSLEWVKRWDLSLEEPGIAFAQYKEFMDAL
ncbi:MAG: sugar phosphate isomerase/epimerase [Eubacteriales bacterium]|nr:sugar phosphate isomerase/epimerase [Eubacteriales bacterium]